MIHNTKIIPKRIERGVRPDADYRISSKLHCAGGVEICIRDGCELYGIVKDDDQLLCFRHYREKHMKAYQNADIETIKPSPKSLLKSRPYPGSTEY